MDISNYKVVSLLIDITDRRTNGHFELESSFATYKTIESKDNYVHYKQKLFMHQ